MTKIDDVLAEFDKEFGDEKGMPNIEWQNSDAYFDSLKSFIRTVLEEAHGQGLIDGSRFTAEKIIEQIPDYATNGKQRVNMYDLKQQLREKYL